MTKFSFEFTKGKPVFYSGETIEGKVTIKTTRPKTIKRMSINFFGVCKCKWEEELEIRRADRSKYIAKNNVWSRKVLADESIKLHGPCELPPGTYTYSFDFQVASYSLTSLEGKYGCIRYEIFLLIERSKKYSNEFTTPITVICPFDLNIFSIYAEPQSTIDDDDIDSCCLNYMDKTRCILSIPYMAYAPGQNLKFNVDTSSTSRRTVAGFYVKFYKVMTYYSKHPKIAEISTETELMGRFYRHPDRDQIEDSFVIPATPPTFILRGIMCVQYFLKVHAKARFCFFSDFETELQITIGTVPIRLTLSPDQFTPAYNEIKPPSYEEELPCDNPFVDGDPSQVNQIVGFRPLYPMYRTAPIETAV